MNKFDSKEFLKQITSAIDSLHLCISCLQVCKVFIEEVLAQKPCMYGNKFRLNLCIRFITHSGSIGHKNRKRKYKNEALRNFNIRLWQMISCFLANSVFLKFFFFSILHFLFLFICFWFFRQNHSDWNAVSELVVGFGGQDKKNKCDMAKVLEPIV